MWRFGVVIAGLLALFGAMATACDPGAGVTWVNQTDQTVLVYSGDQPDDYSTTLQPHSSQKLATADFLWDDVVVLRDEQGNVLFRQKLTWGDLKAQKFRFVITEDMLSPTPSAGL
jgi:hypothetical protein